VLFDGLLNRLNVTYYLSYLFHKDCDFLNCAFNVYLIVNSKNISMLKILHNYIMYI